MFPYVFHKIFVYMSLKQLSNIVCLALESLAILLGFTIFVSKNFKIFNILKSKNAYIFVFLPRYVACGPRVRLCRFLPNLWRGQTKA